MSDMLTAEMTRSSGRSMTARFGAIRELLVVGGIAPENGPILWFNTAPVRDNSAVSMLSLEDDATGHAMQLDVEGKAYGVRNMLADDDEETEEYDYTII